MQIQLVVAEKKTFTGGWVGGGEMIIRLTQFNCPAIANWNWAWQKRMFGLWYLSEAYWQCEKNTEKLNWTDLTGPSNSRKYRLTIKDMDNRPLFNSIICQIFFLYSLNNLTEKCFLLTTFHKNIVLNFLMLFLNIDQCSDDKQVDAVFNK